LALVGEGRTEEALAVADALISANPNGPVAQEFAWEKANIFYSGRNYKSAADELQAYMAKFPQGDRADDALYLLGKSYLTMNEVAQAVDAFADLEKKFPSSPLIAGSKLDLADFHKEQARALIADSLYEIVQRKYSADTPSASRAGFERANIARLLSDTVGAIQMYRATADTYPGTEYGDQARYQLSIYYRGLRQSDSAREELAVLVRTTSDAMIKANALYDIGDTYARERRWEEAVEMFERVRTEYAGYEDWYTLSLIGLGAAYEQLDEMEKAKGAYGVVLQLRPEDDYGKTAAARLKRLERKR
jgi:TolA-binding protein